MKIFLNVLVYTTIGFLAGAIIMVFVSVFALFTGCGDRVEVFKPVIRIIQQDTCKHHGDHDDANNTTSR